MHDPQGRTYEVAYRHGSRIRRQRYHAHQSIVDAVAGTLTLVRYVAGDARQQVLTVPLATLVCCDTLEDRLPPERRRLAS